MPFDQSDLLRQAGYEVGSPIQEVHSQTSGTQSTTSGTFQKYQSVDLEPILQWDIAFQPPFTTVVAGYIRADAGNDAIDILVRNGTDAEDVVTATGITTNGFEEITIGPQEYAPSSTADPVRLDLRFRNQDNSTTVTLAAGAIHLVQQL